MCINHQLNEGRYPCVLWLGVEAQASKTEPNHGHVLAAQQTDILILIKPQLSLIRGHFTLTEMWHYQP